MRRRTQAAASLAGLGPPNVAGRGTNGVRLRPVHAAGPVFSHHDFDPRPLAARKEEAGLTASLCIPARDEAATIGRIVEAARRRLMEAVPLLDEVLVVDDHSTDGTAEVASAAGAKVVHSADVLPGAGGFLQAEFGPAVRAAEFDSHGATPPRPYDST